MGYYSIVVWVNPFGKSLIFRHFDLLVLIAQKGIFSFQNIVKIIFLTNIAEKKCWKNGHIGIKTMEKCQFFDFWNFLFLLPRKAFSQSRISKKSFSRPILNKKEPRKMASFGPKPWVNPFGKSSIFQHFKLLVFIA